MADLRAPIALLFWRSQFDTLFTQWFHYFTLDDPRSSVFSSMCFPRRFQGMVAQLFPAYGSYVNSAVRNAL